MKFDYDKETNKTSIDGKGNVLLSFNKNAIELTKNFIDAEQPIFLKNLIVIDQGYNFKTKLNNSIKILKMIWNNTHE